MSSDAAQLRERFREIGIERIRALNQDVLALEQGDADEGTVDRAMREIHTLKGESRMLGLGALNRVAHRTEDLLLHARQAGRLQDAEWLQHVYAGLDLLAELIEERGEAASRADDPRAEAFVERAEGLLDGVGAPAAALAAPPAASKEAAPPPPPPPPTGDRAGDVATSQRVARGTVDEITRTAGEVGVLQSHLRQFAEEAAHVHDRLRDLLSAEGARWEGPTIERADGLLTTLDTLVRSMRDVGFEVSIRQHRLQAAIERMRLAAVNTLFGRFPRTVRELSQELGKEARLVIEGGEVGADQQILDLLADPLVHLLRNALDHGLEPPDTREAEGKPRRGTIRLGARQAARFVEILVADDGRGIDPTSIAEAAVHKGLLSQADVAGMSDRELFEQLFRPAFSTRATVSDVSGRGVGLDVVKSAIEDLGGSIRVESEVRVGTTFVLRIPVSIAVVDALVLDLGTALYAMPSVYVERILDVTEDAIESTGGRPVVRLEDDERLPVLDLVAVLGLPRSSRAPREEVSLVVVAEAGHRVAFRVPGFVGEMTLVQEALDPFVKGVRLVTGTAMLDGGRRAVILNAVQLLESLDGLAEDEPAPAASPASPEAPGVRTVLVIEDSDLTRSMLVTALENAGWKVLEAVNGRQGLDLFFARRPSVLITDLDMPKLSGFEVIRAVREDAAAAGTPIVVFSTREDAPTRQRAAEAGADVYLAKSQFAEEELLETLARLVAARGRS